jgi:hypothetical protein
VQPIHFPDRSNQLPDRPAFALAVLAPDHSLRDSYTLPLIDTLTREYGLSARTFKSALIWVVAEDDVPMKEEARKVLAWGAIHDEDWERLSETQRPQLIGYIERAKRDLNESVWRTYKNLVLLDKDNTLRLVDLGLVHASSTTGGPIALILQRLKQDGDLEESISPNFLLRNWSSNFSEWSTKAVRDAFFASPRFPRLLNADVIKETIARGVATGYIAYVSKGGNDEYQPFYYNVNLGASDIEISDEVFIIKREVAEAYKKSKEAPQSTTPDVNAINELGSDYTPTTIGASTPPPNVVEVPVAPGKGTPTSERVTQLMWTGEVPPQKWTTFYTKVLTRFATTKGLKIKIDFEVSQADGISEQKVEETKVALRELGLDDDVEVK